MRIQDCGFVYAQQVRLIPEPPSGALRKHQRIAPSPSGHGGRGPFALLRSAVPDGSPSAVKLGVGSFMPAPSRRGVMASEPEPALCHRPFTSLRSRLETGVGLKSSPCRHLRRMGFRAAVGGFVDRSARKRALAKGRPSRDREEGMRAFPSTRGALSGVRASLLTVRRACLGHEGGIRRVSVLNAGFFWQRAPLLLRVGGILWVSSSVAFSWAGGWAAGFSGAGGGLGAGRVLLGGGVLSNSGVLSDMRTPSFIS